MMPPVQSTVSSPPERHWVDTLADVMERIVPDAITTSIVLLTLVPLVATLSITCEDDRLFAQLTGQPRFRIYPESDTKFFYKVVNAQITFECAANGDVERLILHQNGKDMRAARQ